MSELILQAKDITAAARKPRRLRIVAYTGGVMRVENFGPVVIDLSGLELPETVAILDAHRNTVDATIGSGRPAVADGRLVIDVTLADTPAGQRVVELLRAGVALQASIAVSPAETSRLAGGETIEVNGQTIEVPQDGATLVARGLLKEVSVLPLGADGATEVAIAARRAKDGDSTMEKVTLAERNRILRIRELCGAEHPSIEAQAIQEGWTPEKTELEVLRARAQRAELMAMRAGRPNVLALDASSTPLAPARDVLAAPTLRLIGKPDAAQHFGEAAVRVAESLRAGSLLDLCAAALRLEGQPVPASRGEMIRAAFDTTSLPVALGAGVEKVALGAFQAAPEAWRAYAKRVPLSNFKETQLLRLAASARFQEVPPGGELKHSLIGEDAGSIKLGTFGRLIEIDRQAIVNDDLQLLADLPNELGREAARTVGDAVAELLVANPDGFFSASNNNLLTGVDSTLSIDSLAVAIALLRKQTDHGGRPIGLVPRYLLVGPDLEATARALLSSVEIERSTDGQPRGNPLRGALELLVDPRLPAPQWFVLASPDDAAVAVGTLDGRDGPTVEQVDLPPERLGIAWRGYIDFGVALREPRAAVRSEGE